MKTIWLEEIEPGRQEELDWIILVDENTARHNLKHNNVGQEKNRKRSQVEDRLSSDSMDAIIIVALDDADNLVNSQFAEFLFRFLHF